ncbi:MAG: TylF/MycF/NovP-related O-methyltransferase [Planctomycetota bacterium]
MPRSTVGTRKHTPVPLDVTHLVPFTPDLRRRGPGRLEAGSADYLDLLKQCLTAAVYPESAHITLRTQGEGSRAWLRRRVVTALAKRGYRLQKLAPFNHDARANGTDWPAFGYSMIGLKRMDQLQRAIETIERERIEGDFVETGVWRGGAVILMLAVLRQLGVTDRIVWACDSFEGLPAPTHEADAGYDLSDDPYLAVSVDDVRANLERFGVFDERRVRFLKGWFKDTLADSPIDRIAILRLDGDLYESTMDVLTALYDRVQPGGYIIVDDYGAWEPCRKAVADFRRDRGITTPIEDIDGTGAWWRKASEPTKNASS